VVKGRLTADPPKFKVGVILPPVMLELLTGKYSNSSREMLLLVTGRDVDVDEPPERKDEGLSKSFPLGLFPPKRSLEMLRLNLSKAVLHIFSKNLILIISQGIFRVCIWGPFSRVNV